jgi:preprotein translocase subunit SecE
MAKGTKKKKKKKTSQAVSKQNNTQNNNQTVALDKKEAKPQKKGENKVAKTSTKKPAKTNAKKPAKNKKPNIFQRAVRFLKEVWLELKKVTWLTRNELIQHTSVVLTIVAMCTLALWIIDSVLGTMTSYIIGL